MICAYYNNRIFNLTNVETVSKDGNYVNLDHVSGVRRSVQLDSFEEADVFYKEIIRLMQAREISMRTNKLA